MSDAAVDPERWRGPEPWFDRIALAVRLVVWLLTDVHVLHPERLPRTGPAVLAANHVSKLDPLVLGVVVYRLRGRVRFIVVEGLLNVPIVGRLLRATRMIPVQRGAGSAQMAAEAAGALSAGQAVVIYPEGTIPRPDETLGGRPGAGLLALEAAARGVPVVPIASWGLDHRGRGVVPRILRRRATVVIGEPVDLSAWAGRRDRDAQLEVSAVVLGAVRALLPEAERTTRSRRT